MKRKFILIGVISVLFVFFGSASIANNGVIKGCYHKITGKLRIVDDHCKCKKTERSIFWSASGSSEVLSLTLYVNASTGQDKPNRGLTPEKPYKTIGYALDNITYHGGTFETDTLISVAPGTYNENVVINKDRITIESNGADPIIIDGGGQNCVEVNESRQIELAGIIVQNGSYGISAKKSNIKLLYIIALDCGTGIYISENSTAEITNISATRNVSNGIEVSINSSVTLSGNIACNDNTGNGITLSISSSIITSSTNMETKNNGNNGMSIEESSQVNIQTDTTFETFDNTGEGIDITNSSLKILGKVSVERNGGVGIHVQQASLMLSGILNVINNTTMGIRVHATSTLIMSGVNSKLIVRDTKQTIPAISTGISIYKNSSLTFNGGYTLIKNNGGYGIMLAHNSDIFIGNPSPSIYIDNNSADGINISQSSYLYLGLGEISITNNSLSGIAMSHDSLLIGYNGVVIQNNGSSGISIDGSSTRLNNSTITDNAEADISLFFGSRATLNGNTIGTMSCDDTVLIRGDQTCP